MAHHLTQEERDRIAYLKSQECSHEEIAKELKRAPSTIGRELKRNRTGEDYWPGQAQAKAARRRSERPLKRKMERPEINDAVRSGLAQDWSPDQISQRLELTAADKPACRISAGTIYHWIRNDPNRKHWESHLRRRGKRPNRRKPSADARAAARIRNRPEVIEQRIRIGDFEGDTVLGKPGTGGLVTLVCRKSRLTIMTKITSKQADHVHSRIKQRLKELADEQRHSITFDNGTEFAKCPRLEKHLGMMLYWADPGCPYQRGTNENTNGLVRQYFPKGTDFSNVSHHDVRLAENLLNNRPRRCLDYRTSHEVFRDISPPTPSD